MDLNSLLGSSASPIRDDDLLPCDVEEGVGDLIDFLFDCRRLSSHGRPSDHCQIGWANETEESKIPID
jgi:hypothetical protein